MCGTTREVRAVLVKDYIHLVWVPCAGKGGRHGVPQRPGVVLVHAFHVAGYFGGFTYRIADAEQRASLNRATAITRIARCETGGDDG